MEDQYYIKGSRLDIWISNSFFTALNPEQGGSPQKALDFLDNKLEEKESKGMENGKIIHKYCENKDQFAVADVARPADMLGNFLDAFHELRTNYSDQSTGDITIISDLKSENGRTAEILQTQASFEKLAGLMQYPVKPTILLFREARKVTEAYKSYKEGTLVEKVINEGVPYLKQAQSLEGKLTLTVADKNIIEGATNSLYNNLLANKYYNLSKIPTTAIILKEQDVFFTINNLHCKAKLDNIYIDVDNQVIYLNDLKTTSKPLGLFKDTVEYYRYYRQLAWYKLALEFFILEKYPQFRNFSVVCNIIAVETTGNFNSCVFNLDHTYISKGIKEGRALLQRAQYHITKNMWNQSMEQYEGNGVIKLIPDDSN